MTFSRENAQGARRRSDAAPQFGTAAIKTRQRCCDQV
jgi:hypothetical protein